MKNIIMHLLLGNKLLEYYEEREIKLSEEDKMLFLLGSLIPDIYNAGDKEVNIQELNSHFCEEEGLENSIIIPNCYKFFFDYYQLLEEDISAFGYFYHLYLENIFYSSIFPKIMTFLDENYNETIKTNSIKHIKIIKNNKIYSEYLDSIYYEIWLEFNKLLLENYDMPSINSLLYYSEYFLNPGIREVRYSKVKDILKALHSVLLALNIKKNKDNFIDNNILDILNTEVKKFGNIYMNDINKIIKSKQKNKTKHI